MKTERLSPLYILLFFALMMFGGSLANAQNGTTGISLKDAVKYGLSNQTSLKKSNLEYEKNIQKYREALSNYLPQIKASGSINDNLKLATQILPGAIFGQPGNDVAVQFGTKYNVSGGIDANQIIYDQSLLTAIKASKESNEMALLNKQKNEEQIIFDIASSYYSAQITGIQRDIVQANLSKIDTLLLITKSQYENGFAKKTDYSKLLVNQVNLKTELQNIETSYQQQLLLLKFYMAYPVDSSITLPLGINAYQAPIANKTGLQNGITTDLKLLETQNRLTQINLKQIRAGYLPTLSASFRFNYQAQQNSTDFLSNQTNWFPNSFLALNLSIPLFDGFNKVAKTQQLKIQIKQNELDQLNLKENIKMQVLSASYKMKINSSTVGTQYENVNLAEEVYESVKLQYKEGTTSMSELLNAETSLKEAQTNYLKALVQVKVAELDILKSSGELTLIIK